MVGTLLSGDIYGYQVVGACLIVLVGLVFAAVRRRDTETRDPQRMYTTEQRELGFERAGRQCEYARWHLFRCTRTAQHGDHFIPWSKGGATTLANFVASCPRCNTSKGAKMPTVFDRLMLEARRRRYFPQATPRSAGEQYRMVRV